MAVDERARHELRMRLEEVLGTDEATTLMHYLPPMDWSEIATKRDLDQLADRLRVEFRRELHDEVGGLRQELHEQVGGLRQELHQEIGGVREELGGLRRELHREIGGVRGEVGSLRSEISLQSRNLFFGTLASNATLVGLVFAAVKFA